MSNYSIEKFVEETVQKDQGRGVFELESTKMLEVNLDGGEKQLVWAKIGTMVAYRGNVKFTREGMMEHGISKLIKKKLTGEGARLMKAEGQGQVYFADMSKQISVIELTDDAIVVNGNDLLAFEPTLDWDIKIMRKMSSMLAGGLFNVKVAGNGNVAITSHGKPMTLRVTPEVPVSTDPNATIAWSGNLEPEIKTDISFKSFIGRGSGESIQLVFKGDGFVVVQPYEEIYYAGAAM